MSASRSAHGYDALTPSSFGRLSEDEFPELCEQLLRRELSARHALGATVEGSPKKAVAGFDFSYRIHQPPKQAAEDFRRERGVQPLTFDSVDVPVVYSMKTGRTQLNKAKEEADARSDWAVEALRGGGMFVLMLSGLKNVYPPKKTSAKKTARQLTPKPDLRRDLANRYWGRLKKLDARSSDPFDRVHVLDANDLCDYIRSVGCTITRSLRNKLGIPVIPGTYDLQQYSLEHQRDRRGSSKFFWDASREKVAEALLGIITSETTDPGSRIIRFISPPGVGKTRLTIETLANRSAQQGVAFSDRVFAATSAADARAALKEHGLLDSYRDAILVVDDVAHEDAQDLMTAFATGNREGRATLIMMTAAAPSMTPARSSVATFVELEPKEDQACYDILSAELGEAPDPTLSDIVKGYPWFAIIVGRELAHDSERPAPRKVSDAVDIALCPNGPDLVTTIRRHSAALMIVMLLEGESLDLNKQEREELLEAFNGEFAAWPDVRAAIEACAARGLLRPGAGGVFQYVTPAIVELEIAERWLTPPSPRPPLRGRLTSPKMRARLQRLMERLSRLGFPAEELAGLAMPILWELQSARTFHDLPSAPELLFVARHHPGATAKALRVIVERTDLAELQADRAHRRSVMFALESLAGRRDGFDDTEAALFRLACGENESFGNNATTVWAGLFDIGLNMTYRTVDQRFATLERRVHSVDTVGRLVALTAVGRILSSYGFKTAGEALDGPYLRPTYEEARRAYLCGWRLLIESTRAEEPVAARAAGVLARSIRQAIPFLSQVADGLLTVPGDLPEKELRSIREALELAEHHDEELIRKHGATVAWQRIMEHFAASSFRERLHLRVGSWGPVSSRSDTTEDLWLATEGLRPPMPLLKELDWLASTEAVRVVPFGVAIGTVDTNKALLGPILERSSAAPELVSAYLLGRKTSGDLRAAEDAIARLRSDPKSAEAVASSIWRLGWSPQHQEWLIADIESHFISDRALERFTTGAWAKNVPDEQWELLIRALLRSMRVSANEVAIDLLERRMREHVEQRAQLGQLLIEAFERSPSMAISEAMHFAYVWGQAAQSLLELGYGDRVAALVVQVIANTKANTLPSPEVEGALFRVSIAAPEATWEATRSVLERDDPSAFEIALTFRRAKIVKNLPASAIEDWMGSDPRRAALVAYMVSMHDGSDLPRLARAIITTFGARSDPSATLRSDLASTPRAVASLAEFAQQQLARVQRWMKDEDPLVRQFAEIADDSLRRSRDEYAAREEYEARRWGT